MSVIVESRIIGTGARRMPGRSRGAGEAASAFGRGPVTFASI